MRPENGAGQQKWCGILAQLQHLCDLEWVSLSAFDLLWLGLVFTFSKRVWNYLLLDDVYLSSYYVPGTHLNPQLALCYLRNAHDATGVGPILMAMAQLQKPSTGKMKSSTHAQSAFKKPLHALPKSNLQFYSYYFDFLEMCRSHFLKIMLSQ